MSQTIAAISTPSGTGGIGIIRISGKEAYKIAEKIFVPLDGLPLMGRQGYTAALGNIKKDGEVIDRAIALFFRAPKSYTGEDTVELSCHGGEVILTEVLDAVFAAGGAPAGPGEFTRRAFLNGKISLTQAEAVSDLICAQSAQSAAAALHQMEGSFSKQLDQLTEELSLISANLSAFIDYPDDDIPELFADETLNRVKLCQNAIGGLLDNYLAGKIIKEGVITAIIGRPNVGKSTLMNLLAGRQRSIVTDIPGTTRDIVEEYVNIGGVTLHISDTAGIRKTEDTVEKAGVDLATRRLKEAGLVLAVFDGSRPISGEDHHLISLIEDRPAIAIINKNDLPRELDFHYIEDNFSHIVYISANTGEGYDTLKDMIGEVLGLHALDPRTSILLNQRQHLCATKAYRCLDRACEAIMDGVTLDAVHIDIDEAIGHLLELSGKRVTEQVLDSIFDNFCVGK